MLSSRSTVALAQTIVVPRADAEDQGPVTLGAPSAGIAGNSIMVPLLSWLKNETG